MEYTDPLGLIMKIAAIQLSSVQSLEDNLLEAKKYLREAKAEGAIMAALPEMFAVMGATQGKKILVQERFGQGRIQDFLQEQALTLGLWIIGGTIPLYCEESDKIKAACLVYNTEGACVARYDKIHLFDVSLSAQECYRESDTVSPGKNIVVLDTPLGRMGLAVCYDLRFPELFRAMANQGAEFFVIPSAFTKETGKAHWELLTRTRALENLCYVIGACQGGNHDNGRITYGHSLIVDPWGTIVAMKNDAKPGLIFHNLDKEVQNTLRLTFPVLKHQRLM